MPSLPSAEPGDAFEDVRTAARGGLLQLIGIVISRTLTTLFIAVAFRVLGPSGFGLYRQIERILSIGAFVAPIGMPAAALRSIARARAMGRHGVYRGAARFALAIVTVASLMLFLSLFLGADSLATAFTAPGQQHEHMSDLLRYGAPYIPLMAWSAVLLSSTVGLKTLVPSIVVSNVVHPSVMIVATSVGFFLGYRLEGIVFSLVLSAVAAVVLAVYYFNRLIDPGERNAQPTAPMAEMVRFALPDAGIKLFNLRVLSPGIILLGLLSSDTEVGLFSIALTLQGLALLLLNSLLTIWNPLVVDLHQKEQRHRLASLYKTVNRWVATFSMFFIVALLLEPEIFVNLLGGASAEDASTLTSILAVGSLANIATGPCGVLVSMGGRPMLIFLNSALGAVLYIVSAVFLVPEGGAFAMSWIDTVVISIMNLAALVQGRVFYGILPYGKSYLKPLAATGAAALVLLVFDLFMPASMATSLISLFLAGVAYILVLWFAGVDKEERHVYELLRSRLPF